LVELLHLRARRGDGEGEEEKAAAAEWVRAVRKGRRGLAIEAMAPPPPRWLGSKGRSRETGKGNPVPRGFPNVTLDFLCEVESGSAMHEKPREIIRGFIFF
jgi:hypothetical protein